MNLLSTLCQDVRFGLRMLLKNPAFTCVAVLTLAIGIGSCTAMFSVVRAVLLQPLPFKNTDRLVWIENRGLGNGLSERTTQVDNFLQWREQTQTFSELGAYFAFFDYLRYTLTGAGEPQRLRGVGVSENFLDVLGIQPMLGRNFVKEECVFNGRPAAILSYAYWRGHFDADPGIVGKSVTVNGQSTAVVGVLPARFDFDAIFNPGQRIQILVPFPLTEETSRYGNTIYAIGRLKPGATLEQARSEMDVICQRIQKQHPERGRFGAGLTLLDDHIRGLFRSSFGILFGAVLCVLLIACVNLSNLLLARANARRKEFAVRVALGADHWRLVRQAFTESLLLATLGCAAGVPLAFAATSALARMQTFGIPLLENTAVDGAVLAFTAAMTAGAGLLCGVLPALHFSRGEAREMLNESGSRGGTGRGAVALRQTLVISEVALACLLLVGAGLLIRSFLSVLQVNLGFQPEHAVAWRMDAAVQSTNVQERLRYYDRLVAKISALPGIEAVGLTDVLPLGRNRQWGFGAKGVTYPPGHYPVATPALVDQHYLQAMRIPLLAGRYFDDHDTGDSPDLPGVVILNETMAHRLWPGEEALGKHTAVGGHGDLIVIGVVADVRHGRLEEAGQGEAYFSFRQVTGWTAIDMVVRSQRPTASFIPEVRSAIREFDPSMPSAEFTTLDKIVDDAIASRRLITGILTGFSSLALLLASIGLYGVIAYSVGQRTREIGIRLAVGAQRGDVLRLIVGEGLKMAVLGVALGLVAALLVTRLLASQLFGVTAADPFTFTLTAIVLMAVALFACLLPARRAMRVDPMTALRYE